MKCSQSANVAIKWRMINLYAIFKLLILLLLLLAQHEQITTLNWPPNLSSQLTSSVVDSSSIRVKTVFSTDLIRLKMLDLLRTTLKKIIIGDKFVHIHWNLDLKSQQPRLDIDYINRTGILDNFKNLKPIGWTVQVRKFGTNSMKSFYHRGNFDLIKLAENGSKNYSKLINHLDTGSAYELCLHCKDLPVFDDAKEGVRRVITISTGPSISLSNNKYAACKEIITKQLNRPAIKQVVIASAVSSASTVVVVVIFGFWCPHRARSKGKGDGEEGMEEEEDESPHKSWIKRWRKRLLERSTFNSNSSQNNHNNNDDKGRRRRKDEKKAFYQVKYSKIEYGKWLKRRKKYKRRQIARVQSWPQDIWEINRNCVDDEKKRKSSSSSLVFKKRW